MPDLTISAGDVPTAAQFNSYLTHTGGAWNAWTPAVVQSGSVTVTVTEGTYYRSGRRIRFTATLTVTGTGSAANAITVTFPVATKGGYAAGQSIIGSGRLLDTSAGTSYPAQLTVATSTTMTLTNTSGTSLGSAVMTAALASGDLIILEGDYEAATG